MPHARSVQEDLQQWIVERIVQGSIRAQHVFMCSYHKRPRLLLWFLHKHNVVFARTNFDGNAPFKPNMSLDTQILHYMHVTATIPRQCLGLKINLDINVMPLLIGEDLWHRYLERITIAVCMGLHSRLGAHSELSQLDTEIVSTIMHIYSLPCSKVEACDFVNYMVPHIYPEDHDEFEQDAAQHIQQYSTVIQLD